MYQHYRYAIKCPNLVLIMRRTSSSMARGIPVHLLWNMMTSSNGSIFRVTSPLCREFTGHRWIPRYASINGWVNNREAGDLRRHRAQYDVIVINFTNIIMWLFGTLLSQQTLWRRFAFHQNLLPTLQRNYRYLLYSKNCWNRVVGFSKKNVEWSLKYRYDQS